MRRCRDDLRRAGACGSGHTLQPRSWCSDTGSARARPFFRTAPQEQMTRDFGIPREYLIREAGGYSAATCLPSRQSCIKRLPCAASFQELGRPSTAPRAGAPSVLLAPSQHQAEIVQCPGTVGTSGASKESLFTHVSAKAASRASGWGYAITANSCLTRRIKYVSEIGLGSPGSDRLISSARYHRSASARSPSHSSHSARPGF